jgi:succinyl-diaminopimelate desuccinylase
LNDGLAQRVLAQIDEAETVSLLQSLVRVPSVNPPGDIRDAIALCIAPLQAAGFACRTESIEDTKPNLIAEYGDAAGPSLCLNAHLDVVPTGEVEAWTHPPFAADLVDGRVYGRGAGDDKASVTAQIIAGLAIAWSEVPLKGRLIINVVADEEIGGRAGAALMVQGGFLRPDFDIVGEQTQGRVLIGEKGGAGIRIIVYGRAAHGALPWEGANAIEGMARVIVALQDELWPKLEQRTHPYFHHSSASINLISGGVKSNVVADRCEIYVDRRVVPGEDPQVSWNEAADIARRVIAGIPGLRVEFDTGMRLRAATLTDPDSPLVQAMVRANAVLGFSTELGGFSMGTDGRFFADAGCPTIIYGPGDPSLAHVPDEWVGVEEVVNAAKAYALAALSLLAA